MADPKIVPFSPTLRRLIGEYRAQFNARCDEAAAEFGAEQKFPPGTAANFDGGFFIVPVPDAPADKKTEPPAGESTTSSSEG